MIDNEFLVFLRELESLAGSEMDVHLASGHSTYALKGTLFESLSAFRDVLTEVRRDGALSRIELRCDDRQKDVGVYVTPKISDGAAPEDLRARSLDILINPKAHSLPLESTAHISRNGKFVQMGDTVCTESPSRGVFVRHPSKPSIAICTPVFQRLSLLELYLAYMTIYMLPQLSDMGYDPHLVLSGGDEEFEVASRFLDAGNVLYLHHMNNLGDKKNLLLDFAKVGALDYLCFIDSDDLFSASTIKKLIDLCDTNGFWSAIEGFCFLDSKTGRVGIFEGYPQRQKSLHGWGMGSGRVFSSTLIRALEDNPFARKNQSMDYYIRGALAKFKVPTADRLLQYSPSCQIDLPIGIKSDTNIWGYDEYALTDVTSEHPQVSWLPPEFREWIKEL